MNHIGLRVEDEKNQLVYQQSVGVPNNGPKQTVDHILQAANGFSFAFKSFGEAGKYVHTILNRSETDQCCWYLYINDKKAEKDISTQTVFDGDVIDWKLENRTMDCVGGNAEA